MGPVRRSTAPKEEQKGRARPERWSSSRHAAPDPDPRHRRHRGEQRAERVHHRRQRRARRRAPRIEGRGDETRRSSALVVKDLERLPQTDCRPVTSPSRTRPSTASNAVKVVVVLRPHETILQVAAAHAGHIPHVLADNDAQVELRTSHEDVLEAHPFRRQRTGAGDIRAARVRHHRPDGSGERHRAHLRRPRRARPLRRRRRAGRREAAARHRCGRREGPRVHHRERAERRS